MRRSVLFAVLLCCALLSGCAAKSERAAERYFWPPSAEHAKIEYIDFYQSDDLGKLGKLDRFSEALLGKTRAQAVFARPVAIASNGRGQVYVTDTGNRIVHVFDFAKNEIRALRDPKDRVAVFDSPHGIATDDQGRVYVSDAKRGEVLVFGADEKFIRSIGKKEIVRPIGLTVDSGAERLYVVEPNGHRLSVFSLDGEFLEYFGSRGDSAVTFNFPLDAAVDAQGNLYVLDSLNARVKVFSREGEPLRTFGERGTALGSFQIPKAIAVDAFGHVYVTDAPANRFVIFDTSGQHLMTIGAKHTVTGGSGVVPGGFLLPNGIDVDDSGAIWVADSLNRLFHRFQYLTPAYLEEHPIAADEIYLPPGYYPSGR